MNNAAVRSRRRSVRDISDELCELFRLQFEALRLGFAEEEADQYLERRMRIAELQAELKTLVPRPS